VAPAGEWNRVSPSATAQALDRGNTDGYVGILLKGAEQRGYVHIAVLREVPGSLPAASSFAAFNASPRIDDVCRGPAP